MLRTARTGHVVNHNIPTAVGNPLPSGWGGCQTHVLAANPSVVTDNYKEYDRDVEWRTDEDALEAWKAGETGYPIVDAGMRQLLAESYVHNRVRMIVASFLTKDLLIDWREGYDWFREKLVDHDTANDNGGWQWAASTGTDAQPYFRVFNPMTQGERYDPDAEYIAEYVPELADLEPDTIHSWDELEPADRPDVAYPAPIVDHAKCREEAIAMFERARGEA
nr:FAD-binding domain-containing protein [Halovivax sp. TS33]